MPTTRALTARQSSAASPVCDSPFVKPAALGGSSRTLRRSNSSSSLNSVQTSYSMASSTASCSSSSTTSSSPNPILAKGRRGLPRTSSAPNPSLPSSTPSLIRTRSSQAPNKRVPTSAASQPLSRSSSIRSLSSSSSSRSSSTSRSCSSLSTASDSEDEDPEQPPTPPGAGPWSQPNPDDSNKENVAPLWRSLEEADLMSEMAVEQTERLERSRGGRGSLRFSRARQSSPGAASAASSSGAMTVASAPPTTSAPRSFIPQDHLGLSGTTAASLSAARKRRRQAADADDDDDAENVGPSTRSAISRLRMARSQKQAAAAAALASPPRASSSVMSRDAADGDDYMSSSQGTTSTSCDTIDASVFEGPLTRSRSRSSSPATSAPSTPSASHGRKAAVPMDDSESSLDSEPESEMDADAETVRGVDTVAAPTVTRGLPSIRRFTNVYAHAKALLRYGGSNSSCSNGATAEQGVDGAEASIAVESQIVGRDEERAFLQRFLNQRFGIFGHLESSAAPNADGTISASTTALEASGPGHAGALYISGLPGTGKTALVRSVVDDIKSAQLGSREPLVAFVNCVGLTSPREIFSKVLKALEGGEERSPDEAEKAMAQIVAKADKRILIVLDEMDHLLRSRASQNMLYKLFAFAASSSPINSSSSSSQGTCALIGVANSLDLTQRFVPLLASKGAEPAVLHFRAFGAKEISTIVRTRLAGLKGHYDLPDGQEEEDEDEMMADSEDPLTKPPPVLGAAALELASKRIAGGTGDLRKALDACRLAIDMVETEQRRRAATAAAVEKSGDDETKKSNSISTRDVLSHLTPESAPKVSPSHILKVLSAVLGSPQLTKVRNLGLHAKLVLLAFVVAKKRAEAGLGLLGSANSNVKSVAAAKGAESNAAAVVSSVKLQDVFSTYSSMLRLDGEAFSALSQAELLEIVDGLEVHGLVSLVNAGGSKRGGAGSGASAGLSGGMNRILTLQMDGEEVLRGLTTPAPGGASTPTSGEAGTSATSMGPAIVLSSLRRMWENEENRIDRAKGWQKRVEESNRVREEELGGGRGAVGRF